MNASENYEAPRIRLLLSRVTPAAELIHWICESRRIAYFERFQSLALLNEKADLQLFVAGGHAIGVVSALELIDRRCRTGERVFGETDSERTSNRDLLLSLIDSLWRPTLQKWLYFGRSDSRFLQRFAFRDEPRPPSESNRQQFELRQKQLEQRYDLDRFDLKSANAAIDETIVKIESRLTESGRPFLSGDQPGCADILFAAFASPLILPAKCSADYPAIDDFPAALRDDILKYRSTCAGQLACTTYERLRPDPQPMLLKPAYGPSIIERLFNPTVVRYASQLLVAWAPRLQIGNRLIVSSWNYATDVLERDNDFLIAPINAKRIEAVSGPFILGMDRSQALIEQREHVYSALKDADKQPFLARVSQESERLLSEAVDAGGRIDVVNGYARLVAARAAAALFGIPGPNEQDLIRVIRAIFHETFLNQGSDPAVTALGVAAGEELKSWVQAEQKRRRDENQLGHDVLGELMQSTKDDLDASRWMAAGLLVGAIDTTATVVANIVTELLADKKLKAAMITDIDNPRRFLGWCWEALRRRPHNAGMLRQAGKNVNLGEIAVDEGTQVVLLTVGAMHDRAAFDNPNQLRPDRPLDRYLHFGRGLHQCSGRDFNAVQIPSLVRDLLRYDVSGRPRLRTRGPFPDELVVTLKKPR